MPLEGKPLVLLGESDRELCSALAGILEQQGIAVIAADSPDEFLDLLNRHQAAADLVCVNGRLASERGGFLISRTKGTGNIKVVVVAERDDQRADILRYGADEFMLKPVSPDAIASMIVALIAK
jgi:DNA-binding response OmpR family regulator